MSKHIPLPLERRGTRVYSADVGLSRAQLVCMCNTVEQAEEIITAIEMHTPMKEACRLAAVELDEAANLLCAHDVQAAENCAQRAMESRAALTYPPKKETTP